MDVNCISTHKIVYWHVGVPLLVSISGIQSLLWLPFLADALRFNSNKLGREVYIYTYQGAITLICEANAPSCSPGGAGGILGGCGIGYGVGCLSWLHGGTPIPLRHQRPSRICAAPFWQGRRLSVWYLQAIAGCLSIAAFPLPCPFNPTPCLYSSQAWVGGFFVQQYVFFLAACKNTPLAILTLFKARCILNCCSCTRPTCLAIVPDKLKTFKKLQLQYMRFSYHLYHIHFHSIF